ncbi:hypothetical protein [Humibacillus xanthopallidus]|uniref:Uncharacterized protein n=1 Tax=Humibacillus xanthopallidus TaxID=412689 RepID=A0A543HZR4_9MICO|nr:hypothetical protein [Humibacillus xanthopallidus]TQM63808.1 hypothetical protein FBY41_0161 [Humibacillus xanthopallidus]
MRPATRPPARSAALHDGTARGWDRRQLLTVLASGVLSALVFLVGLWLAVYYALGSLGASSSPGSPAIGETTRAEIPGDAGRDAPAGSARGQAYRDRVAAAPMLEVDPDSARRGVPSAHPAPTLLIPAVTRTGPSGVPTGFPKTPAGAVAQLAAIESTVLQGMSIPQVNDVHRQWTLTGAVEVADWPLTRNVQAFLAAAGQGQSKDPGVTVSVTPVAGMVKGVDGDDWVLACVLLDVQAVITTDARVAYGHCERMQWTGGTDGISADGTGEAGNGGGREAGGGRWLIAPGPSPAPAPSTWPGTDLAIKAGWRTWVDAPLAPDARPDTGDAPDAAPGVVPAAGAAAGSVGS